MLAADGYQNFAGPSKECQIAREDIVTNPDQNEDTYKTGRIWYAQVGGRLDDAGANGVRYRVRGVKGYLAELRGRGPNRPW